MDVSSCFLSHPLLSLSFLTRDTNKGRRKRGSYLSDYVPRRKDWKEPRGRRTTPADTASLILFCFNFSYVFLERAISSHYLFVSYFL